MSHHEKQHDDTNASHGFAEGQADEEDESAEDSHRGDYAEGQEKDEHETSDLRRGDYAEGQEDLDHTHATPLHGDYARGQEEKPR
jgi:hypothetical protein